MGEAVQVFDQWKIFTGKFGANFIKYFSLSLMLSGFYYKHISINDASRVIS
jgi:hypothetical protein